MLETDNIAQDRPALRPTTSHLTPADHWDHLLARWAVNRNGHRVDPGLYTLGSPTLDSPVFVTANYTLSFDALRSALTGVDAYILVLDTQGINVWCAAGKGTFGTDELVKRIEQADLQNVVTHRLLILPQLGAPGIAAHEIKRRSHFKVEYGPVRAHDLPEYLKTHHASPEMRRVRFGLRDRLLLIPVELVAVLVPLLIFLVIGSTPVIAALLAGVVLFPILLPYLPTHDFSSKGYILGFLVALPLALAALGKASLSTPWTRLAWPLVIMLLVPSITAFLALNFTGSTTFTSRSGVRREIFSYVPSMAWMFGIGVAANIALFFAH